MPATTNTVSVPAKNKGSNVRTSVIASFVGLEEEYHNFIDSVASKKLDLRLIRGIIHLFPNGKLQEKVNNGLELADKVLELSRQRAVVDIELKKYGAALIAEWNKANKAESMQVSSVRLISKSEDHKHSILITVRDAYSVNDEATLLLKDELGAVFSEVFEEVETYTVKCDKENTVKQMLFGLLKNTFGEKALEFFFDHKVSVKMKNSKKYIEVLDSDKVSVDVKNRLQLACVKQDVSITYPK